MKSTYIEYVHNLKGSSFEHLKPSTQEAIVTYLKSNFNSFNDLQKAIIHESSLNVLSYISGHLDLQKNFRNIVFTTNKKSYVEDVDFNEVRAIINFKKINSLRYINEHFQSVNKLLPDAGIYIGRAETYWVRKQRIYRTVGKQLGWILWMTDFIINRVLPKLKYIGSIYFYITKGIFHTLSSAEVMGRLVYAGFEIIDAKVINGLLYFACIKIHEPRHIESPSYHPLIKLQRVGKGGKTIGVYKLRTMHPYSEFLQDYIVRIHGYDELGKPANDFRVTRWGRFFRKLWIDELPQIINILKGEMTLVGIRPLSRRFLEEYPDDLKKERSKYKPGCIPPYVALLKQEVSEYILSERIYLKEKLERPVLTDFKYFFLAIYNIITNKIRSK